MLTIPLTRTHKTGNAVHGKMVIPFSSRPIYDQPDEDQTVKTLENADYLIPAGTYPLRRTYSPKFNKHLPLIDEVPDMAGIRIHRGSLPEHSTGCVLTNLAGITYLDTLFNRLKNYYDNEEISICIVDDFGA